MRTFAITERQGVPYLDLRKSNWFNRFPNACGFIVRATRHIRLQGLGIRKSIVYLCRDSRVIGISPWPITFPTNDLTVSRCAPFLTQFEDKRFWSHHGIDFYAICRAMFANIRAMRIVQGGSTITQQLVRNLFVYPNRSILRKFVEWILAVYIEKRFTKLDILRAYCGVVYLGPRIKGIDSALRFYHRKTIVNATETEIISVLSCLRTPMKTSPHVSVEQYVSRSKKLAKFVGVDVSRNEIRPVPINIDGLLKERVSNMVDREIMTYSSCAKIDFEIKRAHLTLSKKHQSNLTLAIKSAFGDPFVEAAAGVIVDVETGDIVAESSFANKRESPFSPATSGAIQAGSTCKPFILLEAIEQGLSVETKLESAPFEWHSPEFSNGVWRVRNYKNQYWGLSSIKQGLVNSDNTVYARLVQLLGTNQVAARLKSFGLIGSDEFHPSSVLGASKNGVSLIQIARAYAGLSSGCLPPKSKLVRAIEYNDGFLDRMPIGYPLSLGISFGSQALIRKILRLNMFAPHGSRLSGKSGTVGKNSVFAAYDDKYSYAIWVGFRGIRPEFWDKGITARSILSRFLDSIDGRITSII